MKNSTLFAQYFNANPMWKTVNFDVFHCGFTVYIGPDNLDLMKTTLKEYIDDKIAHGAKYSHDVCKDFSDAMDGYKKVSARGMVVFKGRRYGDNRTHFMFIISGDKEINKLEPDNELLGIIDHECDHMADYVVSKYNLDPARCIPCEVHACISQHAYRKILGFFDWKKIFLFHKNTLNLDDDNPDGGEPSNTTGTDNTSEKGESNERTT